MELPCSIVSRINLHVSGIYSMTFLYTFGEVALLRILYWKSIHINVQLVRWEIDTTHSDWWRHTPCASESIYPWHLDVCLWFWVSVWFPTPEFRGRTDSNKYKKQIREQRTIKNNRKKIRDVIFWRGGQAGGGNKHSYSKSKGAVGWWVGCGWGGDLLLEIYTGCLRARSRRTASTKHEIEANRKGMLGVGLLCTVDVLIFTLVYCARW